MDSLGKALPQWYDSMGFYRGKVHMEAYLQARGLNVWSIVSEGNKHDNHQER